MAHAVFHTGTNRHPKIAVLSDGAFRLWFAGVCYCADHLTDGLIPKAFVPDLKRNVSPKQIAELQAVVPGYAKALWADEGECYRVNDFLDWNESRVEVQAGRQRNRERVRRHRNGGCNGVTPLVTPVVSNSVTTEGNTEHCVLNTDLSVTDADTAWQQWCEAWRESGRAPLPLGANARDSQHCIQWATRFPDADWRRLQVRAFFLSEREDVRKSPPSLGWFMHWVDEIDLALRRSGRKPKAEAA